MQSILIACVGLAGLTAIVLANIGTLVKTYDQIMNEVDQ